MIEWTVLRLEIRHFFVEPRSLLVIPLTLLAAFVGLWPHIGSPFVPVLVVTFALLEPLYNNVLFRSPREFEALLVTPVSWKRILVAKNAAALILTAGIACAAGIIVLFFFPAPVSLGMISNAVLMLWTVSVPMTMIGNIRSHQSPRRNVGWTFNDAAEIVITLVMLGVISLSMVILRSIFDSSVVLVIIGAAEVMVWLKVSIPQTARIIEERSQEICLTA